MATPAPRDRFLDLLRAALADDTLIKLTLGKHRGADATLLRRLADHRELSAHRVRAASRAARGQLREWFDAGWLHLRRG